MPQGICQMVSTDYCLNKRNCYECGHGRKVFKSFAAYEDTDLTPAEVAEYAKAKADGRVVILPCKRGDTVEATVLRPYNGNTFTIYGKVCDIQPVVRVISEHFRPVDFLASDFGKTVFLKDAEKALKEREQNG